MIFDLTLNLSYSNVGLFGHIGVGAKIKNVGLVNVNIRGGGNVGGLVGRNIKGTINNSYVTGSVIGQDNVGGLVGFNNTGGILNSYSTGSVTATGAASGWPPGIAGGLVGHNDGGIGGKNYFVDSDGGDDGIGTGQGRCNGTCERKTLTQLATLTSVSESPLFEPWTSTNWSFGTTSQLPSLKYANDLDTSELECGSHTGVICGDLLPGQGR